MRQSESEDVVTSALSSSKKSQIHKMMATVKAVARSSLARQQLNKAPITIVTNQTKINKS